MHKKLTCRLTFLKYISLKHKIFIQVNPIETPKILKNPFIYNSIVLKDFYEKSKIQPESGKKMPLMIRFLIYSKI
jgi:hypothetical protein